MNTDEMQHQDELEKQEQTLDALFQLWSWDKRAFNKDRKKTSDDALLIASSLGLLKEFKQMIGR